ncbi:A/G-specific adenine glycosylase [Hymenobacter sp. ASUV-10]|uniref:Adenine DNA glycosylase n=1 Tax=Hymenobacter aranciens TaxID=3063996 RepID=A0ABT9B9M7_9BACT|nr:A/G-specific adenine glycosylase [Hymenobacter sp. ASUV-10]MDO7874908.1 A/G-specific adenine glycosylase [Hymenobacter sp. ASUV-10]
MSTSPSQPSFLATALLAWYPRHRRDLPWRHTHDPYAIWLSEVILQQTRVAQGLPYYNTFLNAYPTVADLAAAPEAEVLRYWQGLGYYSRARNMHHTAQQVVQEHAGKFPTSYAELIKLKGIGPYTAAAIASFAFNEAVTVLDGNVYRVLARIFGLHSDIAAPASRKEFQALADQHIPAAAPADFNQAIMEFGAIQCTPVKPDCLFCPLQQSCWAFQHGQVALLPVKSKAKAARTRYFHYFVLRHGEQLYLKERREKDIWQGLYDFALAETVQAELPPSEIMRHLEAFGAEIDISQAAESSATMRHVLSHQKLEVKFHEVPLRQPLPDSTLRDLGLRAYSSEEIEVLPKPVLIVNYLNTH